MRVKPGVYVRLKEGDTVKIGGSSRVYELHWVPLDAVNEPYDVYAVKEGEEGANQVKILFTLFYCNVSARCLMKCLLMFFCFFWVCVG